MIKICYALITMAAVGSQRWSVNKAGFAKPYLINTCDCISRLDSVWQAVFLFFILRELAINESLFTFRGGPLIFFIFFFLTL